MWLKPWVSHYNGLNLDSLKFRAPKLQDELFHHKKWLGRVDARERRRSGNLLERRGRPASNPPQEHGPHWSDARDDANEATCQHAFEFKNVGSEMCIVKNATNVLVTNFAFVKIVRHQTWVEEAKGRSAIDVLLVRITGPGQNSYYIPISATEEKRRVRLSDAASVDVEVAIERASLKFDHQVLGLFTANYAPLDAHSVTRPMLLSLLAQMPPADYFEEIIVRYGKQAGGIWVMSNLAFQDNVVMSHQDAGYSVNVQHFAEHKYYPWPADRHPRIMHIPFDHVRYRLFAVTCQIRTGISGHPPQISPAEVEVRQPISPIFELRSRQSQTPQCQLTTLQIAISS